MPRVVLVTGVSRDLGARFARTLAADGRFDVIGVDSNFRSNPDGPFLYIAVSAASFQPYVADFIAGRTGTRVGAAATGRKG